MTVSNVVPAKNGHMNPVLCTRVAVHTFVTTVMIKNNIRFARPSRAKRIKATFLFIEF